MGTPRIYSSLGGGGGGGTDKNGMTLCNQNQWAVRVSPTKSQPRPSNATYLLCFYSSLTVTAWCFELHRHAFDYWYKCSICTYFKGRVCREKFSLFGFLYRKVMRHIPNLVIMRSLDMRKYANKIKGCWKFWVENQNEKWTGYQHIWNLYLSYAPACRRSYYPQGQ